MQPVGTRRSATAVPLATLLVVGVFALNTPGAFAQNRAMATLGTGRIDVASAGLLAALPDKTIECWVHIPPWIGGNHTVYAEAMCLGPVFSVSVNSTYLAIHQQEFVAGPWYMTIAPDAIVLGRWHHVAFAMSATAGNTIYVDGQPVASAPGHQYIGLVERSTIGATYRPPTCGYSEYAQTNFFGDIDELRLWSYKRTAVEIQADICAPASAAPGLVAAWHFDGDLSDVLGAHNGVDFSSGAFFPWTSGPLPGYCPTFSLTLSQPQGGGSFEVALAGGTPLDGAFTCFSFDAANDTAPFLGVLGGLHVSIDDLALQYFAWAPPFVGVIDYMGNNTYSLPAGSLSFLAGVRIYAISHSFALPASGIPDPASIWPPTGFSNIATCLFF